jgi:ABC-type spermidine/putrescine transport system permease subunit II
VHLGVSPEVNALATIIIAIVLTATALLTVARLSRRAAG